MRPGKCLVTEHMKKRVPKLRSRPVKKMRRIIERKTHIEIHGGDQHGDIRVPESVRTLEPCAFYESSVRRVFLPESLSEIGDCAFYGCSELKELVIPEGSGLRIIGDSAFYGCENIGDICLPDTVQRIGTRSFYECRKLALKRMPAGLQSIGQEAFAGCGELAEAVFGNLLQSIGDRAFHECRHLQRADLRAAAELK